MFYLVTTKGHIHAEKFAITEKDGQFQARSLSGYTSEAMGNSLDAIIREIEAIEEVELVSIQQRDNPVYVYKFFPEYDENKIYASYVLNSKISDAELMATIALVEYDNGGEMVLYSETIFGE